jgi:predicted alpha/beta hydrolase family esterase
VVIYGDNDPYVSRDALADLAQQLGVTPVIIPGGGHLNSDSGYSQFPQLLEIVQAIK